MNSPPLPGLSFRRCHSPTVDWPFVFTCMFLATRTTSKTPSSPLAPQMGHHSLPGPCDTISWHSLLGAHVMIEGANPARQKKSKYLEVCLFSSSISCSSCSYIVPSPKESIVWFIQNYSVQGWEQRKGKIQENWNILSNWFWILVLTWEKKGFNWASRTAITTYKEPVSQLSPQITRSIWLHLEHWGLSTIRLVVLKMGLRSLLKK